MRISSETLSNIDINIQSHHLLKVVQFANKCKKIIGIVLFDERKIFGIYWWMCKCLKSGCLGKKVR